VDLTMEVQVICSADRAFAYMFGSQVTHGDLVLVDKDPYTYTSESGVKLGDMLYSSEFTKSGE
jgi:hypothetical protein